ncbi:DMT family transporter [soil metagenome]
MSRIASQSTVQPDRRGLASRNEIATMSLLAANVIWGSSFVATKPLLDSLAPATLAVSRLVIALAVLFPILLKRGRRPDLRPGTAILGATGFFLVFYLQNLGLERTSATNAALLQSCAPAITLVIAFAIVRRVPSLSRGAAILASVAGVAILVGVESGFQSMSINHGDGLILVSALALAVYFVVGKELFSSRDSLALVTGASIYGLLMLAPFSAVEIASGGTSAPGIHGTLCLVYLGLGASALAYVLEATGLRQFEADQVATFTNLGPVIGVVAAMVFLGEGLGSWEYIGGIVVVAGAWLALKADSKALIKGETLPRASSTELPIPQSSTEDL